MGATAAPSAVTVGMIAAVLGESGKMIQQLDGEITKKVVNPLIMFPDHLEPGLMEHLPMVGEGVLQGGVAKMSGSSKSCSIETESF